MTQCLSQLAEQLQQRFASVGCTVDLPLNHVTMRVPITQWLATARTLRDDFCFEQLTDLCGVDYLGYGDTEWDTDDVSSEGFSRGVEAHTAGRLCWGQSPTRQTHDGEQPASQPSHRFVVIVHLRSYQHNVQLCLVCHASDDVVPQMPSLTGVWPGADWYERETFDLFGIVFTGHPDLRRILTDYGFIGHPLRKDFPLIGTVEVHYDNERQRVVYAPVRSVEPRVNVPRLIRHAGGPSNPSSAKDHTS